MILIVMIILNARLINAIMVYAFTSQHAALLQVAQKQAAQRKKGACITRILLVCKKSLSNLSLKKAFLVLL